MPELLTHLMIAQGCRKLAKGRLLTSSFLIGTVLPDLLARPLHIIWPSLFWFVMPLHTPLGLLLACAFIGQFFQPPRRKLVFYNLLGGAALHLLLDSLQKHIPSGYPWLFPFSWSTPEIGLVWPETSLYLLPLWLGVGMFYSARWFLRRKLMLEQLSPNVQE